MLRAIAVTVFPEMFDAIARCGVTGRALGAGIWRFEAVNPRTHSGNRWGRVDDRPFGGGPGMVMRCEPLLLSVEQAEASLARSLALGEGGAEPPRRGRDYEIFAPSPQGAAVTHEMVRRAARLSAMVFVCGRYEGIDERFYQMVKPVEFSVGDIVVSGGELPAMMFLDSVLRQIPGVLGDENSAAEDSFADGLLDFPHYTRPREFRGRGVPEVLFSGDHGKIDAWRREQSLKRTAARRPDLLKAWRQGQGQGQSEGAGGP